MLSFTVLLLGLLAASPAKSQQLTFLNITAPYENLSNTCISVLNQVVTCDKKLKDALRMNIYLNDEILNTICTSGCASSLSTWARRAAGACGTSQYTDGQTRVLASYMAQVVLEQYSVMCLKNTQGQFCNNVLSSAMSAAMTGSASAVPTGIACHTCLASLLSSELQMPIGNANTDLMVAYSTMTSSCKITGKSITPLATTTKWKEMKPTETPECIGKSYTLKSGDTCRSVALSQGISTANLLMANGLSTFCADFPSSGATLCIPSGGVCKPYQLKADLSDNCKTVAQGAGVTWAQIVSWNPEVGEYCENINKLASGGQVLCVSTPGGDWVNLDPSVVLPTQTSTTETFFTLPPTEFASAPLPESTMPYGMVGYIDRFANDTLLDCSLYRSPPVLVDLVDSYQCSDYAAFYGISVEDLVEWNPSLSQRLGSNGECYLSGGEQYCARRDTDELERITKYCIRTEAAEPGARSTCDGFVKWYGLKKDRFLEWHTGLGSTCEKFQSGREYCTAVAGFRPSNTISTCTRWHLTASTDTADSNPCAKIATRYGLQAARFLAWNPSVKSSCDGIQVGYEYCVGTPQFPGTGGK